LIKKFNQYQP